MQFDPKQPFEILGENSNGEVIKLKISHNKIIGAAKDFEIKLNAQNHAYVTQNGQDLYVDPNELPNYVPVYSDVEGFHSVIDWHVANVKLETYLQDLKQNNYFDFQKLHREALRENLLSSEDKENIYNDFVKIVTQLVQEIITPTVKLSFFEWLDHKDINRTIYTNARHNGILAQQIGKFLKSKFTMIEYEVDESVSKANKYPLHDINAELTITLVLDD